MNNILVTGGAGFIGSELVRYLIKKKFNIINLDKLTYSGNLNNLTEVSANKKYKFFKVDIIAFGSHLSNISGKTKELILNDGFEIKYSLNTSPKSDTPLNISNSMANTINKFAKIWKKESYKLIVVFF